MTENYISDGYEEATTEQWERHKKITEAIREKLTDEEKRIYDYLLWDRSEMVKQLSEFETSKYDFTNEYGKQCVRIRLVDDYLQELFGWCSVTYIEV